MCLHVIEGNNNNKYMLISKRLGFLFCMIMHENYQQASMREDLHIIEKQHLFNNS